MNHVDIDRGTTSGVVGCVGYTVSWDTQDPDRRGWYAEYRVDGMVIDDSEKIWHPDMPRRSDAAQSAVRMARAYARKLSKEYAK